MSNLVSLGPQVATLYILYINNICVIILFCSLKQFFSLPCRKLMNTKISFNQEDQISVFVSEEWATGSVKFDSGYVDLEVGLIAATIRAHCKEISAHL